VRRYLWLAVVCWALTAAAGAQERAGGPPPLVVVRLDDPGGRFERDVARAQRLVADLFKEAGVMVSWRAGDAGIADRALTVTVATAATLPTGLAPEALGVTPSPNDGTRGTQAYVLAERIQAFADEHGVRVAYVLACAIAHETGHLLLPPNAHTGGGIMRGAWNARLFPPHTPGLEGFSLDHARLLQRRARRQVAP
jgi:hypothetical protein